MTQNHFLLSSKIDFYKFSKFANYMIQTSSSYKNPYSHGSTLFKAKSSKTLNK